MRSLSGKTSPPQLIQGSIISPQNTYSPHTVGYTRGYQRRFVLALIDTIEEGYAE